MFGLEMLVLPFVKWIITAVVAIVAVAGVYFGIKRKGAQEAEDRIRAESYRQRQAAQQRIDQARSGDAVIDAKVRTQLEAVGRQAAEKAAETTPPRPEGYRVGDKFKFLLAGVALLFAACAPAVAPVAPVRVEIPSRPVLADCPAPPSPTGTVVRLDDGALGVVIPIDDAKRLAAWMRSAPGCWTSREIQLEGYVEKIENRLRAVAP